MDEAVIESHDISSADRQGMTSILWENTAKLFDATSIAGSLKLVRRAAKNVISPPVSADAQFSIHTSTWPKSGQLCSLACMTLHEFMAGDSSVVEPHPLVTSAIEFCQARSCMP